MHKMTCFPFFVRYLFGIWRRLQQQVSRVVVCTRNNFTFWWTHQRCSILFALDSNQRLSSTVTRVTYNSNRFVLLPMCSLRSVCTNARYTAVFGMQAKRANSHVWTRLNMKKTSNRRCHSFSSSHRETYSAFTTRKRTTTETFSMELSNGARHE